ncbi:MAG TPA: hypothetical protein VMI10_01285 [Terriglobales bacterium]|nr:hypothetical protein [Terriglobales bacterium]
MSVTGRSLRAVEYGVADETLALPRSAGQDKKHLARVVVILGFTAPYHRDPPSFCFSKTPTTSVMVVCQNVK